MTKFQAPKKTFHTKNAIHTSCYAYLPWIENSDSGVKCTLNLKKKLQKKGFARPYKKF